MRFPARARLLPGNGPPREAKKTIRARIEELRGDLVTKVFSITCRLTSVRATAANRLGAVGGKNARVERQFSAFESCPRAERQAAPTLHFGEEGALGSNGEHRLAIYKAVEKLEIVLAQLKILDAQNSLAHGRKHSLRRQDFRDARRKTKAVQTGLCEDDGIALPRIELAEARIHVASHFDNLEIRANGAQLRSAAQAARGNARAAWKRRKRLAVSRDQRVARIVAAKNRQYAASIGKLSGNILHAVNGDVGAARKQRLLELFREHALNAHLLERGIGVMVAGGLDHDDFRRHAARLFQRVTNAIGLPESERAAASADAQGLQSFSSSRPKRWRKASTAPRRPRIAPPRRMRWVGCSRTRSINSSVMRAMRARSPGDTSFISASFSRIRSSRCL